MADKVQTHYGGGEDLAHQIAIKLEKAGKNINELATEDLSAIDEFHIRGRKATLELGQHMALTRHTSMLDIGSGLGGPARTLAQEYGCHVTGIDLTQAFCDAANQMSEWVNLESKTIFQQGDATNLPYDDDQFDAAMTIHVAMNIQAKDEMYKEAKRVIKPGGVFAIYDVLKGEGGDVLFPVPWAREPSISHLETKEAMEQMLTRTGFEIIKVEDSSAESHEWFQEMMNRMSESGPPPVTFQTFLGDDFPEMVRNQIQNLADRRIRTVTLVCKA